MFNWRRQAKQVEPAVLNEDYLQRLAGHMGEDVLREILSDGLLELTDRIETIKKQVADGDTAQLSKTVHDLAGMSGHLGLSQLSMTAVEAERTLRSETDSLGDATQALCDAAPEAIAVLRDFLDGADAN